MRNGLGLEWVPNKYVYYGEYSNNKKNGFGVMKTMEETFMGFFVNNAKTDKGYLIEANGRVCPVEESRNIHERLFERESFERDPFL